MRGGGPGDTLRCVAGEAPPVTVRAYVAEAVRRDGDAVRRRVVVPEGSALFDGHFPGEPVLPGVAQISLVLDLLRDGADVHAPTGIEAVRFRDRVVPGEELDVVAEHDADRDRWAFRIAKRDGRTVGTGVVACGRREAR